MKIANHVRYAFEFALAGEMDAALLHACIAVDATSKLMYSKMKVGKRFTQTLRDYYWIIEPMMGMGVDLAQTRFTHLPLSTAQNPDLADIVYEIHRCSHAHGDEVPEAYTLTANPFDDTHWSVGKGELHLPDRLVWALIALVVFAKINERQKVNAFEGYVLRLGKYEFDVANSWGKEAEFRRYADAHNQIKISMQGLGRLAAEPDGGAVGTISIVAPDPELSLKGTSGPAD